MTTTVGLRNSKIALAGNAVLVNCGVADTQDSLRQLVRYQKYHAEASDHCFFTDCCHGPRSLASEPFADRVMQLEIKGK
jgi:hypothetical protein